MYDTQHHTLKEWGSSQELIWKVLQQRALSVKGKLQNRTEWFHFCQPTEEDLEAFAQSDSTVVTPGGGDVVKEGRLKGVLLYII